MFFNHLKRTNILETHVSHKETLLPEESWCYFRDFEFNIEYISTAFVDDGQRLPRGFVAHTKLPLSLGMFDESIFSGIATIELLSIPVLYKTRMNRYNVSEVHNVEYKNVSSWYPVLCNGWFGLYESRGKYVAAVYSRLPRCMLDDFEAELDVDKFRSLSMENRRRLLCLFTTEILNVAHDMSSYADVILDDIQIGKQVRRISCLNSCGVSVSPLHAEISQCESDAWSDSFFQVEQQSMWKLIHVVKSTSSTQSRII